MDPDKKRILEATKRAEKELQDVNTVPFTPSAFKLLKEKISRYISDLVIEAIRVSKRNSTDDVSATHVEEASKNVIPPSRRKFTRHLGIIGGVFIGFAFSKMLTMIHQENVSTLDYFVTSALGIAGAILLGYHMAKN